MGDEVTYNEIVSLDRNGVRTFRVAKSYVEGGRLILMLESSEKIVIGGRKIDTTGHKKRIQEMLDAARGNGSDVDPLAVKHYAAVRCEGATVEYVLVKW